MVDRLTVWDVEVRLFHWTLAVFFGVAYIIETEWPALHAHAGYTVLLLIGFRIVWGFTGSRHARFADFVTGPHQALRHLVELASNDAPRHIGHNPAGGVMVLLLLTSLAITAITGTILYGMEGQGPIPTQWVAAWPDRPFVIAHEIAADATLALVVLHVAGVILTSLIMRENLIKAMFTGDKAVRR